MLYPDFGGHGKGARLRKDLDLNADLEWKAKTFIPSAQYDRLPLSAVLWHICDKLYFSVGVLIQTYGSFLLFWDTGRSLL